LEALRDKWLKTRVPVKAKGMEEKESRNGSKPMPVMIACRLPQDGKETAPGFGRVVIDRVELGHLSPILKAIQPSNPHPPYLGAARYHLLCQAHRPLPKDRPSPFADIDFAAGFAKHRRRIAGAAGSTDPVVHRFR